VDDYFGNLLFPDVPRHVRTRKMQALRFGLVVIVLAVAAVVGLIVMLSKQGPH
jgi:hypothetical protein